MKSDVQGQYQVRNVDPGIYTVRRLGEGLRARRAKRNTRSGPDCEPSARFLARAGFRDGKVTVQDSLQVEVDPFE